MCNHGNYSDRLRGLSLSVFVFICALIRLPGQPISVLSLTGESLQTSDKRGAVYVVQVLTRLFAPLWPETMTLSDCPDKPRPPTVSALCRSLYTENWRWKFKNRWKTFQCTCAMCYLSSHAFLSHFNHIVTVLYSTRVQQSITLLPCDSSSHLSFCVVSVSAEFRAAAEVRWKCPDVQGGCFQPWLEI